MEPESLFVPQTSHSFPLIQLSLPPSSSLPLAPLRPVVLSLQEGKEASLSHGHGGGPALRTEEAQPWQQRGPSLGSRGSQPWQQWEQN